MKETKIKKKLIALFHDYRRNSLKMQKKKKKREKEKSSWPQSAAEKNKWNISEKRTHGHSNRKTYTRTVENGRLFDTITFNERRLTEHFFIFIFSLYRGMEDGDVLGFHLLF